MRSRLLPTELRDPATGLPSLASLDNQSAVSLVLGRLALLAGDLDQPREWSALAGDDPASGRPVWAHFQELDRPGASGVLVTHHDGPPYAPGSRELTDGSFVEGATDVFWRVAKVAAKAVEVADRLLALALRESP
jgi:hypothetical protein